MLTGQETISELHSRFPKAKSVLHKFGMTLEAEAHFRYKNLAHAAIIQKMSLQKILEELSVITGEKIKLPKVSGILAPLASGLNRFGTPEGIKKVVAVHSGKGGVGKTFVAVNVAATLAHEGYRVGLLDADVDCPNIMNVLNLTGKLISDKDKKIVPLEKFGIKVLSMAPLLQQQDQVLLWRGPIVSRVIEQFIYDTAWGELDFLIIDLPPGTSDIPLTILNLLKEAEMLIVTTPQPLALLDAKKSANMAQHLKIKILGIVENMSGEVFGKDQAKKMAEEIQIPYVGTIELNKKYAIHDPGGKPSSLQFPILAKIFKKIIKNIKVEEPNHKK